MKELRLHKLLALKQNGNATRQNLQELKLLITADPECRDFVFNEQHQFTLFNNTDDALQKNTPSSEQKTWQKTTRKIAESSKYSFPQSKFIIQWILVVFSVILIISMVYYFFSLPFKDLEEPSFLQITSFSHSPQDLQFEDGSEISLNRFAMLSYDTVYNDQRIMKLDGQAYFDVARMPEKPFVLYTSLATISVTGTKFAVASDNQSTKIIVKAGSIRVIPHFSGKAFSLAKGDAVEITPKEVSKISPNPNDLAWKTYNFKFDNTPMVEAAKVLQEVYGIDFLFKDDQAKYCTISGNFQDFKESEVIYLFQKKTGMRIRKIRKHTYAVESSFLIHQ